MSEYNLLLHATPNNVQLQICTFMHAYQLLSGPNLSRSYMLLTELCDLTLCAEAAYPGEEKERWNIKNLATY